MPPTQMSSSTAYIIQLLLIALAAASPACKCCCDYCNSTVTPACLDRPDNCCRSGNAPCFAECRVASPSVCSCDAPVSQAAPSGLARGDWPQWGRDPTYQSFSPVQDHQPGACLSAQSLSGKRVIECHRMTVFMVRWVITD